MSGSLTINDVTHHFDSKAGPVLAVENISLKVAEHEFVAIVGPSGCGKTTVLNIVSGLLSPSAGQVMFQDRVVDGIDPDIGYMPARDSLYPWRTCLSNVTLPLEFRGIGDSASRRETAAALMASVGLEGFQEAFPNALSHGMRQRVAIARTFASQPRLLLMDEPFSALDAQTKIAVEELFLEVWEKQRQTVLLITHDIMEAVALADRVVVFSSRPGRIKAVYDIDLPRPRSVQSLIFENPKFQEQIRQIWRDLDD